MNYQNSKNKRILVFFFYILLIDKTYSQYNFAEKSFGTSLHYGKNYNPGIIPEQTFHLNVIGVFQNVSLGVNSPISHSEFIKKDPLNSDRNILYLENIYDRLKSNGQTRTIVDLSMNIFDLGIRTKDDNYYNFGLNFKTNIFLNIDQGLIEALPFLGEGFTGNEKDFILDKSRFMSTSYAELFLGFSTKYENWTLGARVKFLYGLASSGYLNDAYIRQNSDYSLELKANYKAKIPNIEKGKDGYSFSNFIDASGFGLGLDIGATYRILVFEDAPLTFGASLIDIGWIRFSKGYNYNLNNEDPLKLDAPKIEDLSEIDFTTPYKEFLKKLDAEKDSSGYIIALASTVNLSTDWEILNGQHIGFNYLTRFYGESWVVAGNLYYSYIGKWGGISPAINFYNYTTTFGLSGFLDFKKVILFVGTDNLFSFNYKDTKSINFNFGLSLVLGNISDRVQSSIHKSKKETLSEDQLKKIDESKKIFKRKNNINNSTK